MFYTKIQSWLESSIHVAFFSSSIRLYAGLQLECIRYLQLWSLLFIDIGKLTLFTGNIDEIRAGTCEQPFLPGE